MQIARLPAGIEPYFYRNSDGTECDLVLVRGLTPLACIEIKLGNVVGPTRDFRNVIQTLGTTQNFIITYSSEPYRLAPDITVVGLRAFVSGGYLDRF